MALEKAQQGQTTAMIWQRRCRDLRYGGTDPFYERRLSGRPGGSIPGVTAASSGAAVLGAPSSTILLS